MIFSAAIVFMWGSGIGAVLRLPSSGGPASPYRNQSYAAYHVGSKSGPLPMRPDADFVSTVALSDATSNVSSQEALDAEYPSPARNVAYRASVFEGPA